MLNKIYKAKNKFISGINDLIYYTLERYIFIGDLVKIKNFKNINSEIKQIIEKLNFDLSKIQLKANNNKNIHRFNFNVIYDGYICDRIEEELKRFN